MKLLWIGKYASEEIFQEMSLKGYKDPAAQVSQSNLINAFDMIGIEVDTLNAYNVPEDYQDKYVKSEVWSRTGLSKDISVGFRNIKYVSQLIRTRNLKILAKQWSLTNQDEEKIIILVYGMQSSLLAAAIEAKKNISNSEVYLIVPDLPQYMDMAMSKIKKILKRVDWLKIRLQLNYVDGYILYSRHMAKYLNLHSNKWIVMEGTINSQKNMDTHINRVFKGTISVMYSGNIDKKYGIRELLRAIELIYDPNYEFWFTGTGNGVKNILDQSKTDNRIKYLGFLTSRQDLLLKQQQATMLINMRLPTEEGSSFCFPSKILEYMASGRPVLSFKIEGIPDEYYEYLIEIKSSSAENISKAIKFVGDMSEVKRSEIGSKGKEFVLSNKNAVQQAKKILEFIK
ncbi:MAG: glycosyltransferase [Clostridiaceae bacterium]